MVMCWRFSAHTHAHTHTHTRTHTHTNIHTHTHLDALCLSVCIVCPCVHLCMLFCANVTGFVAVTLGSSFGLEQCCRGCGSCQCWNSVFPTAKWVRTAGSHSVSWKTIQTQASHRPKLLVDSVSNGDPFLYCMLPSKDREMEGILE